MEKVVSIHSKRYSAVAGLSVDDSIKVAREKQRQLFQLFPFHKRSFDTRHDAREYLLKNGFREVGCVYKNGAGDAYINAYKHESNQGITTKYWISFYA